MKTYNRMMILSITCYVVCAIFIGFWFSTTSQTAQQLYRVEVNRMMRKLQEGASIQSISLTSNEALSSFTYLPVDQQNKQTIEQFYKEDNTRECIIVPWFKAEELQGYLKFYYTTPSTYTIQLRNITQISLFVFELLILLFFRILKKQIITPFHQLSELPTQLSQGHYKGEIHVEKSRYFEAYLQGMSQLKDTLDISKKRQYELMKEKKQLFLSISHDIKTPLNVIKLYSKALQENVYEDEGSKTRALRQIEKKSENISQYVDTMIATAKEEIFDFDIELKEFYLAQLLDNVLPIYQEQCRIRNITCKVSHYHNRLLKGDLHRAQEVIENIFENAFKYGDGRDIIVTFDEEEYHQLIHIRNTGSKLQQQEILHVFDSFFRGSNAQTKSGSGLGLYICKELMRKMRGDIYAQFWEDGMEFVIVFS